MGKGSQSPEEGVRKQLENLGQGYGSTQSDSQEITGCLFSFKANIHLGKNENVKVGLPCVLTLSKEEEVIILIGTSNLEYKGPRKQKIKDCLHSGYSYIGQVEKITEKDNVLNVIVGLKGVER